MPRLFTVFHRGGAVHDALIVRTSSAHVVFKLHTLKEAYVKALGKGLSYGIDNIGFAPSPHQQSVFSCEDPSNTKVNEAWTFRQLRLLPDVIASAAVNGAQPIAIESFRLCERGYFQLLNRLARGASSA